MVVVVVVVVPHVCMTVGVGVVVVVGAVGVGVVGGGGGAGGGGGGWGGGAFAGTRAAETTIPSGAQLRKQDGKIVLTTATGILDHEEARRRKVGGKSLGFFY